MRSIAVLAVAVAAGATGPSAIADFAPTSTPVDTGKSVTITDRAVAVDSSGTATVSWEEDGGLGDQTVNARRVNANGVAGPILSLGSPSGGSEELQPVVASSSSGRSFVAWGTKVLPTDPIGVEGRWIEADGTLGPILTVQQGNATNDATEVRVVISNAGVATVLWRNQKNQELGVRRIAPDGTLGTTIPNIGSGTNPEIAALPDGTTVAVWLEAQIKGNTVSAGGAAGTPTLIAPGEVCGSCAQPGLAIDANGDGLVAWRFNNATNGFSVLARRLTQTGAPTGDVLTIDPLASRSVDTEVAVAADSQDDFMVAWNRQDASEKGQAWARRLNETGAFAGAPRLVSAADAANGAVIPILDDTGRGAIAWQSSAGANRIGSQGRVVGAGGAPVGPKADLVAKAGTVRGTGAPAAGVAGFVSQTRTSGDNERLDLSRYLAPPTCLTSQATVVQGKPVNAKLDCFGPGQIRRAVVTIAPKHGKVGAFNPATRTLRYTPTPGYAGPDSFSYRAVNDGGQSNVATVTIAVGKDTVKPVVTKLRLKKTAKGLAFATESSERARSRIVVRQGGKKLGVVRGKKLRRRATIAVKGQLLEALRDGGKFRATAIARDAAGNASQPKNLEIER